MAITIRMDGIGVIRVDEEEDVFSIIKANESVDFPLTEIDHVVTALTAIRAILRPLAYRL